MTVSGQMGGKRLNPTTGRTPQSLDFNLDYPIISVLHWATQSHFLSLGKLAKSEVRIKFACWLISSF